jgi:hypothetical protein
MKSFKLFTLIIAVAFLWGCSGSSNTAPPGISSNTINIVANGGNATTIGAGNNGGNGGGITFGYLFGSSDYSSDYYPFYPFFGDVSVTQSGTLDTSFTVPVVTSTPGANILTISNNTTATLVTSSPCAGAAGPVYLYSNSPNLYYCDPTYGETQATDLNVQTGATLTLPGNYTTLAGEYGGGTSSAQISLSNTVTINGTVNAAAAGVQLSIVAQGNLLQIGSSGLVTTKSSTTGTDGSYIYLYSGGVAINQGTIDTSGNSTTAAATDGSNGGGVDFEADTYLYNTGSILARGGASTYGNGGKGRHIHLYAYSADLNSSGTIDNSGGNGALAGGNGGYSIKLYGGADYYDDNYNYGGAGNLIVGGSVLSNGGNGGTGNGGSGGYIDFESYGGKLWSNPTVSLNGGSSTAAIGGGGGDYNLFGAPYLEGPSGAESNGIILSGSINLSGGNGATGGGNGGYLTFENDLDYNGYEGEAYGLLPSPAAAIVGISGLTMNGGTGDTGGMGGIYFIFNFPYYSENMDAFVYGGLMLNQVPVSATGGAGTTTGGAGGGVWFNAPYIFSEFEILYYFFGPYESVSMSTSATTGNLADIDVSGGTGATGGEGGVAWMAALGTVVNTGAINANAGAGTVSGGNGYGFGIDDAPWGGVVFMSMFNVVNSGNITASGGNGGATGGYGGYVSLNAGGQTQNSATIAATGGNGTTTGGAGGEIFMDSYDLGPTIANLSGLSVAGGTGPTPGTNGMIDIPY